MSAPQIIILITSALTISLVLSCDRGTLGNRLGCAIGLLGQPFWLWENMRADQFGMFAVGIWFTGWYAFGLLRPGPRRDADPEYVDVLPLGGGRK
jgi:hypothetical protein